MRVVTHPRVFDPPSPPDQAIAFCRWLRAHPQVLVVEPGARHWMIFIELIQLANCKGNLIPDAWFAALAIEHGSEWLTLDRAFARFPGLRWRFPEAAPQRGDA